MNKVPKIAYIIPHFFLRGWLTVPDLTVSTLTTIVKDETTPFQGGLTVPYQTPSWVTVFDSHY